MFLCINFTLNCPQKLSSLPKEGDDEAGEGVMVQGSVVIITKNQRSLAVSVQRCYFSLIALKLR